MPEEHAHRDRRARPGHPRDQRRRLGARRSAALPASPSDLFGPGPRPERSATSISSAPNASAPAVTAGVRSTFSMQSLKSHRDDDHRDRADGDQPRQQAARRAKVCRTAPARQRPHHAEDLDPEVHRRSPPACRRGARRRTPGRTPAQLPAEERARQHQVRRARDRQELREALDGPEQDGGSETHAGSKRLRNFLRLLGRVDRMRPRRVAGGGRTGAIWPLSGLRPCRMIAIAEAMNTVE